MRNCTGRGVAVPAVAVSAAEKCCTGVAPQRLQFKLEMTCEALEGSVIKINCKHEGSEKPCNVREGYSCFQTSNDGFPTEA